MKDWIASFTDAAVRSPGIGIWIPSCEVGEMIVGGQIVGHIDRAGLRHTVRAPQGEAVRAAEICPAHTPVEYGSVLYRCGEVQEGRGATATPGLSLPAGFLEVCAPMAGTLYQQASPGAPAFAPEGATVNAQVTVALVEVMKSLNPVRSAVKGRVERWLVADGEPVSSGQVLLWMSPADTTG